MSTLNYGLLLGILIVISMFQFLKTADVNESEQDKRKWTLKIVILASLGLIGLFVISKELFIGAFLGLLVSSIVISLWMKFFH